MARRAFPTALVLKLRNCDNFAPADLRLLADLKQQLRYFEGSAKWHLVCVTPATGFNEGVKKQ
jgi:hypothetical protein